MNQPSIFKQYATAITLAFALPTAMHAQVDSDPTDLLPLTPSG